MPAGAVSASQSQEVPQTLLPRLGRLNVRGPQGGAEKESHLGTRAQGEIIHPLTS